MLLPTNGRLGGGALRDDTKSGCVADYLSSFRLRLFLGGSLATDFKSAQLEALNRTCDFSSSNLFRFF